MNLRCSRDSNVRRSCDVVNNLVKSENQEWIKNVNLAPKFGHKDRCGK